MAVEWAKGVSSRCGKENVCEDHAIKACLREDMCMSRQHREPFI